MRLFHHALAAGTYSGNDAIPEKPGGHSCRPATPLLAGGVITCHITCHNLAMRLYLLAGELLSPPPQLVVPLRSPGLPSGVSHSLIHSPNERLKIIPTLCLAAVSELFVNSATTD